MQGWRGQSLPASAAQGTNRNINTAGESLWLYDIRTPPDLRVPSAK